MLDDGAYLALKVRLKHVCLLVCRARSVRRIGESTPGEAQGAEYE